MLTRVTITGADDAVSIDDLRALSKRYPFVEWGVLMSSSRQGTPRYPSEDWCSTLHDQRWTSGLRLAAHLCGREARAAVGDGDAATMSHAYSRTQINGYHPTRSTSHNERFTKLAGLLRFQRRNPHLEIILQARGVDDLAPVYEDARHLVHGSVLFDPSGGRGVSPESWPAPAGTYKLGYAGGIGPDNAAEVAKFAHAMPFETWIDMESGVRTDDAFDIAKVEAVLAACAPIVGDLR